MNAIPITISYQGMLLKGHASTLQTLQDAVPSSVIIYIQGWRLGTMTYTGEKWTMDQPIDPKFVDDLGNYIRSYMRSIKKAMNYGR